MESPHLLRKQPRHPAPREPGGEGEEQRRSLAAFLAALILFIKLSVTGTYKTFFFRNGHFFGRFHGRFADGIHPHPATPTPNFP